MLQGTNDSFELLQKSLRSLEVSLEVQVRRQSDFDSNVSSQFFNVQNSVQSLSSIQNNIRQDLNRLRTINLYEGCIEENGACQLTTTNFAYLNCATIVPIHQSWSKSIYKQCMSSFK